MYFTLLSHSSHAQIKIMSRLSQKSSLNFDFNEEDNTNNDDDDDAVSDVDPEELQKMLEVS